MDRERLKIGSKIKMLTSESCKFISEGQIGWVTGIDHVGDCWVRAKELNEEAKRIFKTPEASRICIGIDAFKVLKY